MTLMKKSDWPSLINGNWLSDFFDNDRFFDSDWMRKQSVPAVNVKETEKGFDIELAAPGLSKKDFNITVENKVLTISSEKKEEKEEKEKEYTRREFSYSSFSRSFALPENVNEENVHATYTDGLLKLSLTKKALPKEKATKAIEVM
jgi:HSP20 family protein